MRRRYALLLIALASALLVPAVLILSKTGEPQFEGKHLSYWLEEITRPRTQHHKERAAAAIKSMGTNAIPFLVEDLQSRDSALLRRWNPFVERLGLRNLKMETAWEKGNKASRGLSALGALSDPIVAELERVLNDSAEVESQDRALWQLQNIGPRSLHVLLRSKDPAVDSAIHTILDLDTREAVPILVNALKSDSPDKRLRAADYSSYALKSLLWWCGQSSGDNAETTANVLLQLVSALIDSTRDSSDKVRAAAKDTFVSVHAQVASETNGLPPQCAVVISNALLQIERPGTNLNKSFQSN